MINHSSSSSSSQPWGGVVESHILIFNGPLVTRSPPRLPQVLLIHPLVIVVWSSFTSSFIGISHVLWPKDRFHESFHHTRIINIYLPAMCLSLFGDFYSFECWSPEVNDQYHEAAGLSPSRANVATWKWIGNCSLILGALWVKLFIIYSCCFCDPINREKETQIGKLPPQAACSSSGSSKVDATNSQSLWASLWSGGLSMTLWSSSGGSAQTRGIKIYNSPTWFTLQTTPQATRDRTDPSVCLSTHEVAVYLTTAGCQAPLFCVCPQRINLRNHFSLFIELSHDQMN